MDNWKRVPISNAPAGSYSCCFDFLLLVVAVDPSFQQQPAGWGGGCMFGLVCLGGCFWLFGQSANSRNWKAAEYCAELFFDSVRILSVHTV